MIDDINARVKGTSHDRGPDRVRAPRRACLVSQREVGIHSPSFADALHSALREDPDVVLVASCATSRR